MAFRRKGELVGLLALAAACCTFLACLFPWTALVVAAVIAVVVAYCRWVVRPRVKRERLLFRGVFERTFASAPTAPKIRFSGNYGYPVFIVLFDSPEEMSASRAQIDDFEREIAVLCKPYHKVRKRPFDLKQAIIYLDRGRWGGFADWSDCD